MRFTFKKEERLCSHNALEELYQKGKSFHIACFKVIFLETKAEAKFPVQLVISVPKRSFKRAVDRNLLKRQIREAYRLNKHLLYEKLQAREKKINLMLIYTAKEKEAYETITESLLTALNKLAEKA